MVLDIESLTYPHYKCCSGSPKITRGLSRKGSNRMERQSFEEVDESSKKLAVKVEPSQLELLKLPFMQTQPVIELQSAANSPILSDSGEGRSKRFNHFTIVHPRKIFLIFATMSSMGTIILIYFTLVISRRGGS